MSIFVESLRRLYKSGKVNFEKISELLSRGKISEEEFNYITG